MVGQLQLTHGLTNQREQRKCLDPVRVPLAPSSYGCVIQLSAMGRHLSGEQRHRVLDQGVVHDAALVEIANELVHPVLTTELLYSVYAITGIAKHPDLTVEVLVLYAFEAGQNLAEGLETLDVGVAEGSVQLRGLTQKAQQTRLAV